MHGCTETYFAQGSEIAYLSQLIKVCVLQVFQGVQWGQYTGLKDSNGFEIYEGDILKVNGIFNATFGLGFSHDEIKQLSLEECKGDIKISFVTPVVWFEGGFCISESFENDTCIGILDGDQRFSYDMFECIVIGNVFENSNSK